MSDQEKPTHTLPGGKQDEDNQADNGVVNDSFGTVDTADTTGTGEENQPCDPREAPTRRKLPHHESSPRRT
jgi:hypothetical protein